MFNFFGTIGAFIAGKLPNMNNLTANDYYQRLQLIALSLFEWEGLPESCNARYLEKVLYTYGRAMFINDPELGYLTLKCTPSGQLNVYDEPLRYTAVGTTYSKEFEADNCVIIRNNLIERPTDYSVMLFASRLTEAERTIDTNVKAQKTPYFITCDEKDRLSMINVFKKIDENETLILGSKMFDVNKISVLTTNAPFVVDKLQNYKHEIWNEALTFFGINNANNDKRERLITDEVNANNEVIGVNAEAMLLTRQEACEQINKKYNLNVSVKMRDFKEESMPTENVKNINMRDGEL